MAKYSYDDAGNMAAYFLLTFLVLVLVPITLSAIPRPQTSLSGCQCTPCIDRRRWLAQQKRSLRLSKKALFLLLGWSFVAFVSYRVIGAVVENHVYDPFEILGIKTGTPEKEIKSHYKKLSLKYHPDKVKATANQTLEMIQEKFVQITKAYKSLTDETIRKNWELYGNPDGRQEMSMGIALPQWIVESKNNIWVLGLYGLLFGGVLPAFVGRWWFGNREITKDGIRARTAAEFFKSLREESNVDQVIGTLGKSYSWEHSPKISTSDASEIQRLAQAIGDEAGKAWKTIESLISTGDESRRRGLILVYAHMLRIEIKHPNLIKEQIQLLHQTPLLLSALLNITLARNWLSPALDIMRLHAYLVQALPLSVSSLEATDNKLINPRAPMFAQLPGISSSVEANSIAPTATHYNDFVHSLKEKGDVRLPDVKMALSKWGHVDLLDAVFKVIDERVVSPSSIVYLVVKLRLKSPIAQTTGDQFGKAELAADEVKRRVKLNDGREEAFLKSRGDAEELDPAVAESASMLAHAPRWPGERKPSWWIVLADEKANRVVVPPLKVTDIPYARFPHAEAEEALFEHDYRAYKIQFQVPPNVGMFTWKVYVVSDTFVGEEATRNITMKIEEAPSSATDEVEDEISDPDEDTLAGQMAAMRGGAVKKRQESDDDDSDDEDSNDDSNSSSSDSD